MPRKRDRRHDNPGRPYEGSADVEFKVRLSKELGGRVVEAAEQLGLKISDWWRHAAEAGLKHPPKG